jgi:hypothetical protein
VGSWIKFVAGILGVLAAAIQGGQQNDQAQAATQNQVLSVLGERSGDEVRITENLIHILNNEKSYSKYIFSLSSP